MVNRSNDKNYIQYVSRTIANGDIAEINTFANFFYLISNSTSTDVQISINDQAFQSYPEGLSLKLLRESDVTANIVRVKNVSGGNLTFVAMLSNGEIYQNNTNISGTINADDTPNDIDVETALSVDSTGVTVSADAAQKELVVYNAGPDTIYWGDALANIDPASNKGIPILAGETASIPTSSAVAFKCAATETATVHVNRLRKT